MLGQFLATIRSHELCDTRPNPATAELSPCWEGETWLRGITAGTSQHNLAQGSRSIPKVRGIQERWQNSHRRVPEPTGPNSKQSLHIHPKTAIQLLGSQIPPGQEVCSIPACPRQVGDASAVLCTLVAMAMRDRGADLPLSACVDHPTPA